MEWPESSLAYCLPLRLPVAPHNNACLAALVLLLHAAAGLIVGGTTTGVVAWTGEGLVLCSCLYEGCLLYRSGRPIWLEIGHDSQVRVCMDSAQGEDIRAVEFRRSWGGRRLLLLLVDANGAAIRLLFFGATDAVQMHRLQVWLRNR